MSDKKCPVCGEELSLSSFDNRMFFCKSKTIYITELQKDYKYVEYTFCDFESFKITLIQLPPYLFAITDDLNFSETEVSKMEFSPENSTKLFLTVPYIMKMPWSNKDKVFTKIKTLVLFS